MNRLSIFLLSILILLFLPFYTLVAQGNSGDKADQELLRLIDLNTAGVLNGGDYDFSINILPKGLLIGEINVGIFETFNIGISYGAVNFIGSGELKYYDMPGFKAKVRLFTETRTLPSFLIGFDSQGKGEFIDSLKRYEIKSPGIYFSTVKNFKFLGYLSLHGQINYSLENGDREINYFIGLEKTIGPSISVLAEYDLGLNDNSKISLGKNRGNLNLGIRWSVAGNLTLGVDFRNMLNNKKNIPFDGPERGLVISYYNNLF